MDPIVKWAGGKRKQAKIIAALMRKECNNYIEPFLGGGALFFKRGELGLSHKRATLSDTNKELMSMYRQIRDDPDTVYSNLLEIKERYENRTASSLEASTHLFLEARRKLNEFIRKDPNRIPAELFIFINKVGFNGLYRKNKKGEVNTPYGKHSTFSIPKEDNFFAVSEALKRVSIVSKDFTEVMDKAKQNDTVYCDPPYWPVKNDSFVTYVGGGFTDKDHVRLAEKALELKNRGVNIIVSNSNAKPVKELYKDFSIEKVMAPRSINSDGRGRGKVKELIFY